MSARALRTFASASTEHLNRIEVRAVARQTFQLGPFGLDLAKGRTTLCQPSNSNEASWFRAAAAKEGKARPGEILWLRYVVKFAVSTGLRRGEICALQWQAVNLTDRLMTVGVLHDTKGHHQRSVPLAEPAMKVLRDLYVPGVTGYVFRGVRGGKLNGDYLGKVFKKYVRLVRLPDNVDFHGLRHTCASWLVMNGVPLRVVQEILGHSSMSTTEIYSHLAPGAMREAMYSIFKNL